MPQFTNIFGNCNASSSTGTVQMNFHKVNNKKNRMRSNDSKSGSHVAEDFSKFNFSPVLF